MGLNNLPGLTCRKTQPINQPYRERNEQNFLNFFKNI